MKTEWCEHIEKGSDAKVYCVKTYGTNKDGSVDGEWNLVYRHWKFCPVCGAERPKEARKLMTILEENYFEESNMTNNFYQMSRACLDAVCEVIDDYFGANHGDQGGIKQALRERLL